MILCHFISMYESECGRPDYYAASPPLFTFSSFILYMGLIPVLYLNKKRIKGIYFAALMCYRLVNNKCSHYIGEILQKRKPTSIKHQDLQR